MQKVQIDGSSFNVSDKNFDFWELIRAGKWEPATFRAIASQLRPDTIFIDFGAWIGPISLFAATKSARVCSYEPDPVAAQTLRENIALNPELSARMSVFERAVWPSAGTLKLGAKRAQGDSMSSVMHTNSATTWDVETVTPDDVDKSLDKNARVFLKIDIEGAEYAVVPAMGNILSRPNVAALVSFHPRFAAGNHFRWNKTFPLTHGVFRMFRGYNIYRVHKNSFRRARLMEILAKISLPIFETRITYLFVKPPDFR